MISPIRMHCQLLLSNGKSILSRSRAYTRHTDAQDASRQHDVVPTDTQSSYLLLVPQSAIIVFAIHATCSFSRAMSIC